MGSLYKPKYKDKDGTERESKVYWIKYYRNGKPYRESSKTTRMSDAKRLLAKREGEIAAGKMPGIHLDRVTFDELAGDLITDYQLNKRKSLQRAEISIKRLGSHFKGARVVDITTAKVKAYVTARLEAGASTGTVNRELSALKRALTLGAQCSPPKVGQVPYIAMMKENNVRKGFFEHDEYLSLYDALPFHLKPVLAFAYQTGWRKAEILGLTWSHVDLGTGTVRLEAGETKNDQGRTVFMGDTLKETMRDQLKVRHLKCPFVFHHNGEQIKDFRGAWKRACQDAGVEGKLFHDLRRTAIRNMVRAGIPETIAMSISGHKTRTVFDRYNIVSLDDLKQAAMKQEIYFENVMGKDSGKVGQKEGFSGAQNKAQVVELRQ